MINIAIFASGSGTNAEEIIRYFVLSEKYKVALVFSNRPKAGVLERAKRLGVPFEVLEKKDLTGPALMALMKRYEIDFIVLAGFLCMVPDELTKAYPGMYGAHVHEAVVAAGEKETGITIHYINERYDEGEIIFQKSCPVSSGDTPEMVATKVHALEYACYPVVIEQLLGNL